MLAEISIFPLPSIVPAEDIFPLFSMADMLILPLLFLITASERISNEPLLLTIVMSPFALFIVVLIAVAIELVVILISPFVLVISPTRTFIPLVELIVVSPSLLTILPL